MKQKLVLACATVGVSVLILALCKGWWKHK